MIRTTIFGCMLVTCQVLLGQVQLDGIVVDPDGQPILGALVQCAGQNAIAGREGRFHFSLAPDPMVELQAQSLGYESMQQSFALAQDTHIVVTLRPVAYDLEQIELTGSWIKEDQPFTYSEIDKQVLEATQVGQDVPFLLRWLPSMVVTSDAGTGIGYTGLRIRGSDPTRINVTIDGIPLNDAESQGVFWVDLPDLSSSAQTIQVQRGVGTSTNGAGSFGGTINVKSNALSRTPFAILESSAGSYGTLRGNVRFGSGLLSDRFAIEGRLSKTTSDGYIDRGASDLRSFFLSSRFLTDRHSLKVNLYHGKEVTYQAWNGVPQQYIDDPTLRTFNTAGDRGDGTFHPDEVDDYQQTHLHVIWKGDLGQGLFAKVAGHYTRGKGYFEQYRIKDPLADYNLSEIMLSDTTFSTSDLIRRRWLDNDFYGGIFSLTKELSGWQGSWTLGGGYHIYEGRHFGQVIWGEFVPDVHRGWEYYRNDALKRDLNLYAQYEFRPARSLSALVDLQWRHVDYEFEGLDDEQAITDQRDRLDFFNPKMGLHYQPGAWQWYYSLALAHREPNRDDYVESGPSQRPKPERLIDQELGVKYRQGSVDFTANLYHMSYRDQLILTGVINDVGAYVRSNVSQSYRAGLELASAWQASKRWLLHGNATLSVNRIRAFEEAVDNWDTGRQAFFSHRNTPIAFSPATILAAGAGYSPIISARQQLTMELRVKYVGKQYLDNTGSDVRSLGGYHFTDLHLRWNVKPHWTKDLLLKVMIRNLWDNRIVTNGWTYRYRSASYDATADDPHAAREQDDFYNLTGLYPQAGRNLLVGLTLQL